MSQFDDTGDPEGGGLFFDVWEPEKKGYTYLSLPFYALLASIALYLIAGNALLAFAVFAASVFYCCFSIAFRNDKRFNRHLWLTGDYYENLSKEYGNSFVRALGEIGIIDNKTKFRDVWYAVEEAGEDDVLFHFSTRQPGKNIAIISGKFAQACPIFGAYKAEVEPDGATACYVRYLMRDTSEALYDTYDYRLEG